MQRCPGKKQKTFVSLSGRLYQWPVVMQGKDESSSWCPFESQNGAGEMGESKRIVGPRHALKLFFLCDEAGVTRTLQDCESTLN